ncbi:MAG: hypothetical protein ACI8PZ_005811, partial [Myxococcota bacterium]
KHSGSEECQHAASGEAGILLGSARRHLVMSQMPT